MTKEQIIEGNIILAEFMGFKRYYPYMTESSELSKHYKYPCRDKVFDEVLYVTDSSVVSAEGFFKCINIIQSRHIEEFRFHNSITWLFPVIQKIFSLPFIEDSIMILKWADVNLAWSRKEIGEIWESCVRFIKWYNNQKKE